MDAYFLFVQLSIGLAFLVAVMQTAWHRTEDSAYLRMTRFWGKLFLIFLESTFLGLWIFGWDRLSPRIRPPA